MKIVKINVQDGLGEIEVALHSHTEASRLTSFLNDASVALEAAPTPPTEDAAAQRQLAERFSEMRDSDKSLEYRIETAIERIRHGHSAMRIPVEATDPDVVLQDCLIELTRRRAIPPAPEVEPVAEVLNRDGCVSVSGTHYKLPNGTKLYTRPANDGLRKAAEELLDVLDKTYIGASARPYMDNIRAELNKDKS